MIFLPKRRLALLWAAVATSLSHSNSRGVESSNVAIEVKKNCNKLSLVAALLLAP